MNLLDHPFLAGVKAALASSPQVPSGLMLCSRCDQRSSVEERREKGQYGDGMLRCPNCGCPDYYLLDVDGRRIK